MGVEWPDDWRRMQGAMVEGGSHGRWPIYGTFFCGLSIAVMYLIIWDFLFRGLKKNHLQIKVPVAIHWKHIARPRITGKLM